MIQTGSGQSEPGIGHRSVVRTVGIRASGADYYSKYEDIDLIIRSGYGPPRPPGHTVATGVAGDPTAPGRRSGGAVSRNRLRPLARSQSASSVRYHISPR